MIYKKAKQKIINPTITIAYNYAIPEKIITAKNTRY